MLPLVLIIWFQSQMVQILGAAILSAPLLNPFRA